MTTEPPDLPASRVLAEVRAGWDESVVDIEHVPWGAGSFPDAFHWVVRGNEGPRWFATADLVSTDVDRGRRLAAYETAAALAEHMQFVLAPEHDRAGRIAIALAPGYLVSVSRYVAGESGPGPYVDETEREAVARMLGHLHSSGRPGSVRIWQPRFGWRGDAQRTDLLRVLEDDTGVGGPFAARVRWLVGEAREALLNGLTRFDLLAAAMRGSMDRWVLTHGQPDTANLLRTTDGTMLVNWESVAVAPRERDLRHVLEAGRGAEAMQAYVSAGGRAGALSPDTLELFELEWRLSDVAEHALRFSGPHQGTDDDLRFLNDLDAQLAAVRGRTPQ